MKKYIVFFFIFFCFEKSFSQSETKDILAHLKECLQLNANNQPNNFTLFEKLGIAEITHSNTLQRIKLADILSVKVTPNNAGYSVDIKCIDEISCIVFIKNDTSNSNFQNTAFQFNEIEIANTFTENFTALVNQYKTNDETVEKILSKDASGNIPLLSVKKVVAKKTIEKQVAKIDEQNEESSEDEVEKVINKTERKKSIKKETAEATENTDEPENVKPTNKRKTKNTTTSSENDESETIEKPSRNNRKNKNNEDENASEPEIAPEKTKRNKVIEDVTDNQNEPTKSGSTDLFCKQLNQLLTSGKENKFKSVEGKLTNTESKLNESNVKLKGAKKNYLSWYKKERAFIAELKSGNDYETVFKEYENIQTQLDECLGSEWATEDHSNNDEYAKLNTEVKDVEFKKEGDDKMPSIRIIFLETEKKYTLFLRIQ